MSSKEARFIKVPGEVQTMPVDQAKRIADSEIQVEPCTEEDAHRIAEGLYTCFPATWWDKKEPPELRPATHSIRVARMAKRLTPSISQPGMYWIKAVHIPTRTTVGVAGWAGPDLPLHNIFRRSATQFFGWQTRMNWSDAEMDDMWAHVDDAAWSQTFARDDETRSRIVNAEPHWYLAPLITWPEWQGRGVGRKLLDWALQKADAEVPPTPMYLESQASARAVYMHVGFVPQGAVNFLRRGPAVVKGLEEEEEEKEAGVSLARSDGEVVGA